MTQCKQHSTNSYKMEKAGLIKDKKIPESSRALEVRVASHEAKTENSGNKSFFPDFEKANANNRNNPALDRKGSGTKQSCTTI